MRDEQRKNIDDVFRQVVNNPANEPEYQPENWDALEEMLTGKKKPVKKIYWLPLVSAAAAMMLVTLGWWYLTPQAAQNANYVQPVVIKKKFNGTGTPQQGIIEKALKANPTTVEDKSEVKNIAFTAKNTNSQSPENNAGDKFDEQKTGDVMPAGKVNKNDRIVAVIDPGNKDNNGVAILGEPRHFTLPNAGIATHSIEAVKVADKIAKIDRVAITAKADDENWLKKPRLAITVLSSADLNGINSFSSTNTGKNIGMLFSAKFNKLSISTGAYYSVKPYTMPFSDYSPNSTYKFKYSPETVTADCRMLDIPLNIDYQVFAKNKNSISVGTGISSFIMLKENYKYNYAAHVYGVSTYNVNNPDKYLFSSVNFQANYRRQINSKVGINVMPYLKVPLSDIGYSRVKLQTVGVAVGLNWNINPLAKPR